MRFGRLEILSSASSSSHLTDQRPQTLNPKPLNPAQPAAFYRTSAAPEGRVGGLGIGNLGSWVWDCGLRFGEFNAGALINN